MTAFHLRVLRAAWLDSEIYEEVEADRSSIGQASIVVFAACAAIGAGRWLQGVGAGIELEQRVFQVTLSVVEPLVLWVGGSAFSFMVGATFFRGPETETDFLEVLRTTGFAFVPSILRGLAFLDPPILGLGIDLFARAWWLVCVVVAVRQALDFTTPRAIATYGLAAAMLWLMLWGISVVPLPPLPF